MCPASHRLAVHRRGPAISEGNRKRGFRLKKKRKPRPKDGLQAQRTAVLWGRHTDSHLMNYYPSAQTQIVLSGSGYHEMRSHSLTRSGR